MVKPRLNNAEDATRPAALFALRQSLITALKLLHPFTPFITEEIFLALENKEPTIMLSKWPVYSEELSFEIDERNIETVKQAVKSIRDIRVVMNVPHGKKLGLVIVSANPAVREVFERERSYIIRAGGASDLIVAADKTGVGDDAVSAALGEAAVYIPLADLVDKKKEIERLTRELAKAEKEMSLCKGKLSNPGFIAKAPQSLIESENEKLRKFTQVLDQLNEQLAALK